MSSHRLILRKLTCPHRLFIKSNPWSAKDSLLALVFLDMAQPHNCCIGSPSVRPSSYWKIGSPSGQQDLAECHLPITSIQPTLVETSSSSISPQKTISIWAPLSRVIRSNVFLLTTPRLQQRCSEQPLILKYGGGQVLRQYLYSDLTKANTTDDRFHAPD